MLTKLAIWWLRKTRDSVIINCEFDRPSKVITNNELQLYDNHLPEGMTFIQKGMKVVITRTDEESEGVEDE